MDIIYSFLAQHWAVITLVVALLLLLLLMRNFWCWYLKINQRLAVLERIEQLLIADAKRRQNPEQAKAAAPAERSPYLQGLSGEELEEGLKGLVLRAEQRPF